MWDEPAWEGVSSDPVGSRQLPKATVLFFIVTTILLIVAIKYQSTLKYKSNLKENKLNLTYRLRSYFHQGDSSEWWLVTLCPQTGSWEMNAGVLPSFLLCFFFHSELQLLGWHYLYSGRVFPHQLYFSENKHSHAYTEKSPEWFQNPGKLTIKTNQFTKTIFLFFLDGCSAGPYVPDSLLVG